MAKKKENKSASYLEGVWDRFTAKLGPLAALIPQVAESVKIGLGEGDAAKVSAQAVQLREVAAALAGIAAHVEAAVDDGSVDLAETSTLALKIEKFLDELGDVASGVDG